MPFFLKKKKQQQLTKTKQNNNTDEKANKGSDDNFRSGIIVYFQNSRQNILCGIYSDAFGRNVVQLQREGIIEKYLEQNLTPFKMPLIFFTLV